MFDSVPAAALRRTVPANIKVIWKFYVTSRNATRDELMNRIFIIPTPASLIFPGICYGSSTKHRRLVVRTRRKTTGTIVADTKEHEEGEHHVNTFYLSTIIRTGPFNLPQMNVNTSRPRQNGCHFPDDIFKCIFWNENVGISIKSSLKFVPRGLINNIPAMLQLHLSDRQFYSILRCVLY